MDKDGFPYPLQVIDKDMMYDPVSEIRSEDLSQLRLLEHKADRTGGSVGLPFKFLLEFCEVFLQVIFKPEGIQGISLVPPANEILPVNIYKRKDGSHHAPPRTHQRKLLLDLSSLFTSPLLKFTSHALLVLLALVVADQ